MSAFKIGDLICVASNSRVFVDVKYYKSLDTLEKEMHAIVLQVESTGFNLKYVKVLFEDSQIGWVLSTTSQVVS